MQISSLKALSIPTPTPTLTQSSSLLSSSSPATSISAPVPAQPVGSVSTFQYESPNFHSQEPPRSQLAPMPSQTSHVTSSSQISFLPFISKPNISNVMPSFLSNLKMQSPSTISHASMSFQTFEKTQQTAPDFPQSRSYSPTTRILSQTPFLSNTGGALSTSLKNLAFWCVSHFPASLIEVQQVLDNQNLSEAQQQELITAIIHNHQRAMKNNQTNV